LHACGDEARPFRSFLRAEKMMADLERRKQTEEAPFSIDDRQAAQAPFLEQMNGVVGSRVGINADDVAFHDIAHPVGEIADENRRLDSELVQDEIDPLIRVPGAGRDHIRGAGDLFEMRVGDGRADRIHVRVFVADDKGVHAREVIERGSL
jgi:hypothetical protein